VTEAAAHLIEEFKALPEPEREEVLAALLAAALSRPYATPTDEALTGVAEQVFLELDGRSSAPGAARRGLARGPRLCR